MKRLLLIVLSSISLFSLQAQLRLDYHASYATYNMDDMKDLLQTIKFGEPFRDFGMETVENFPAYIAHSVNVGYRLNRHEFGLKSSYYTTGGKLSVGDYSGKINITLTTSGFREGVYYRNYFYTLQKENSQGTVNDRFSLWAEVSPAIIISTLKMKTVISDVDLEEIVEEPNYNENAYSLLVQFGGKYYLCKTVSLDLSAGYDLSFGGNYDQLNGSPRADWSGLRISGGLGITF